MDAMARALLNAADILENSPIPEMLHTRYASFDSGAGKELKKANSILKPWWSMPRSTMSPGRFPASKSSTKPSWHSTPNNVKAVSCSHLCGRISIH